MGGGPQPQAPAAPDPSQTAEQAIQDQIRNLPDIYKAQKEFGPQFTQLELDQLREFGPQYAEEALKLEKQFGTQLAEQTRAEQAILAPERVAGSEFLAAYISGADDLTPLEEKRAKQTIRAGQADRGMAFSGSGAEEELKALTEMRQQLKSRKINTALGAAGWMPQTGGSTVNAPSSFGGALVQNVTPTQTFGLAASNYASQANIYNTNVTSQTARRGQNMGLLGDTMGMFSFGFGGG